MAFRGTSLLLLGIVGSAAAPASAASAFFFTPTGATAGGQPVNATVDVTTSAGRVDVVVQNQQANPRSIIQAVSGLFLTLEGGPTGGSIFSSSGNERAIAASGTFADLGPAATGWGYSNDGTTVRLNVLGTQTAPEHLVIGPPDSFNVYANANDSIAGNVPHNPFLGLSATFRLDLPDVSAATRVLGVVFQFGTAPGNNVPGTDVPEPATTLACLAALPLLIRRRRRD